MRGTRCSDVTKINTHNKCNERENLPAPASRETAYGASRQQAGKEAHPRAASLNQVGADVSSTLRCRFANREN